MDQSREMAKIACHALSDKKAEDIRVQALIDAVGEELGKRGHEAKQVEGNRNSSWILMDYRDIIVHIFSKEDRLFYDLERIWTDGKSVEVSEL